MVRSLLAIVVLAAGTSFAQDPVIRKQTTFVSVPAVVRDSSGRLIRNLSRASFQVFENGKEQKIVSFEAVDDVQPAAEAAPDSKLQAELQAATLILLLDQFNTPAIEQATVREKLASFYKRLATVNIPTAVVLFDGYGMRILQQPSTDAAAVARAIGSVGTMVRAGGGAEMAGDLPLPDSARENLPSSDGQSIRLRQLERLAYYNVRAAGAVSTQNALGLLAGMFSPMPGQKIVIWSSAGTTVPIDTSQLISSGMRLYALNLHRNLNYRYIASFTVPTSTSNYNEEVNDQLLRNMRDAAEQTGGGLCNDDLHPEHCIHDAIEDASSYYLLGYQPRYDGKHPEWREIKVKVRAAGAHVLARDAVLLEPQVDLEHLKRAQIQAALRSPFDMPGIPLELKTSTSKSRTISISLVLRADDQHPAPWAAKQMDLTIAGEVLRGGKVVKTFAEDVKGKVSGREASDLDARGLAWTRKLTISGATDGLQLRFAARDNANGRIGTVTRSFSSLMSVR